MCYVWHLCGMSGLTLKNPRLLNFVGCRQQQETQRCSEAGLQEGHKTAQSKILSFITSKLTLYHSQN